MMTPSTPFVIGPSFQVSGDLSVEQDVVVLSGFEGRIFAAGHKVTVSAGVEIRADIDAREVVVQGTVRGSVTAESAIEIAPGGYVDGDLRAAAIRLTEGARLRGGVNTGMMGPAMVCTSGRAPGSTPVRDDAGGRRSRRGRVIVPDPERFTLPVSRV